MRSSWPAEASRGGLILNFGTMLTRVSFTDKCDLRLEKTAQPTSGFSLMMLDMTQLPILYFHVSYDRDDGNEQGKKRYLMLKFLAEVGRRMA
jgi:hypothetical protein